MMTRARRLVAHGVGKVVSAVTMRAIRNLQGVQMSEETQEAAATFAKKGEAWHHDEYLRRVAENRARGLGHGPTNGGPTQADVDASKLGPVPERHRWTLDDLKLVVALLVVFVGIPSLLVQCKGARGLSYEDTHVYRK